MKDDEPSTSLISAEDEESDTSHEDIRARRSMLTSPSSESVDSDSYSSTNSWISGPLTKSNRTRPKRQRCPKRRRCRDAADDELSNIAYDRELSAAMADIAVDPDKEDSDMHSDEEDSDLSGDFENSDEYPEGPQ